MTALQLLAYIAAALSLQLVVGLGLAAKRRRAASEPLGTSQATPSSTSAGAWSGWREFRVVRREYEDAAHSQCSFYLRPEDGLPLSPFMPGQYLTFSLNIGGEATRGVSARQVTRCYSLSDRPDTTCYRVTIKRVPPPQGRPDLPPGMSSSHFHDHVQAGDLLQLRAPAGHFFLDRDSSTPVVLVAGGIGITPMVSMLRWCVTEQPDRVVNLYYGLRNGTEHAFKQLLADLSANHPTLKLNVVYSNPRPDDVIGRDCHFTGHVDLALLRRTLPHGHHQFYVCGPPPMMSSLVPALREWGVPEADLHFEAFGPATARPAVLPPNEPAAKGTAVIDVRFRRSARSLSWDGRDASLLDFAERHDVPVDSGCRSGSCGACETRLLSGSVLYAEKPDHDIAAGHCLLCVGRPQTALVLDA